jgi:hypothetical protein
MKRNVDNIIEYVMENSKNSDVIEKATNKIIILIYELLGAQNNGKILVLDSDFYYRIDPNGEDVTLTLEEDGTLSWLLCPFDRSDTECFVVKMSKTEEIR